MHKCCGSRPDMGGTAGESWAQFAPRVTRVALPVDSLALLLIAQRPRAHGSEAAGEPMNRSGLAHAIGVSVAVQRALRVTRPLLGAAPFFDHAGSAREVVAPGLQVIMGAFDASLEECSYGSSASRSRAARWRQSALSDNA